MIKYFCNRCCLILNSSSWPPATQALKLYKHIAGRQLRIQGACSVRVRRGVKEMLRAEEEEAVWCPLCLKLCSIWEACPPSQTEKAGRCCWGVWQWQAISLCEGVEALLLLSIPSQVRAEAFFSRAGPFTSQSWQALHHHQDHHQDCWAKTSLSWQLCLCCRGVMGRAASKAQHQQASFYGFSSQRWREMTFLGGERGSPSYRDAGRMEVGWFREQLSWDSILIALGNPPGPKHTGLHCFITWWKGFDSARKR